MFIVKYRKIFFVLSALLITGSIFSFVYFGFNFGIDFKGGSVIEVSYPNGRPSSEDIKSSVDKLGIGNYVLQPVGDANYSIKTKEINQGEKKVIENALSLDGKSPIKEEKFNTVGPTIGTELRNKAYIAIGVVMLCIIIFITFAFRKVSEPVASWKYGLITIIALLHDVIIPTGIFVLLGKFFGAEIDLLFVSALLAILGYSVHDTIVVFDRVRENLRLANEYRQKEGFEDIVGKSVNQTFVRSVNTSMTTFLALLALFILGSEATRNFSLILMIGVIVGTYSSIFVGSPLLVTVEKWQNKSASKN